MEVAENVIAGTILSKTPPVFPDSARESHISGTVKLAAVIGRDGHIRSLHLLSTPDGDLAIAAINAVRTWTYRPYVVNGEPVDVETTITVNFNFR